MSHPSLGLPPPPHPAELPVAAARLSAARDRLAMRALEIAIDRDPTIRDRYPSRRPSDTRTRGPMGEPRLVLAVVVVGAIGFVILGGVLAVTAGLIVAAGLIGWLVGLLVRPPVWAALIAVGAIALGLLGIWLFGRWEGGVLDPIEYFAEVQGFLVPLELLAGGGMAAAASR